MCFFMIIPLDKLNWVLLYDHRLKNQYRYGRKPAVLVPYFIAACFSFGTATAKDIQTILITRFFAGLFGSAPVTNTGGVLGDIWSPQQRGSAIVGYAFAVVGGPTLGVSLSMSIHSTTITVVFKNSGSIFHIRIFRQNLTAFTANCRGCYSIKLSEMEMD